MGAFCSYIASSYFHILWPWWHQLLLELTNAFHPSTSYPPLPFRYSYFLLYSPTICKAVFPSAQVWIHDINICSLTMNFIVVGGHEANQTCTLVAKLWLFVHALSILNAERQVKKQHVLFLKSLEWLNQGSNHWPPRLRVNAQTITPLNHTIMRIRCYWQIHATNMHWTEFSTHICSHDHSSKFWKNLKVSAISKEYLSCVFHPTINRETTGIVKTFVFILRKRDKSDCC